MRQLTFRLLALLFLLAFVTGLNAQTYNVKKEIRVVTTAVPFLRISPDARAGGMGETGIATLPDANSGFWNLAKTPFNTSDGALSLHILHG